MPMRRRDLTVSSSPSAAAPSAPGAPGAGGVTTIDGGAVLDVGTVEPSASELVAVLVILVVDVDVPDIYDV